MTTFQTEKADKFTARWNNIENNAKKALESNTVKYILVAAGVLLLVFVTGYIFRILATTVVGYKQLRNAINA